jgi:hypothetical protein
LSVLLSIYLVNINSTSANKIKNNNNIYDLSFSVEEDISQIESLITILNNSESLVVALKNDLDIP